MQVNPRAARRWFDRLIHSSEPPLRLPPRSVWITLAIAVPVAAAVGAWLWLPPAVAVVHPLRGPAVEAVYATGTVEPSVMLPIAARLPGLLVELDADEGQRVHKGQQLGRVEDTDLVNALAQLRSQEAFAKDDYERDAALLKRGLIARSIHDKARTDWQAAAAASAKAAAELGYARLLAPADGTVIHRDGEVGELIAATQVVFWVAVDSPPRISAEVDEEDIARVAPGQAVLIRADAFPGRVFHGRVQSITPKGDPTARSYRVRIGFSEPVPLLTGMTAETNIVTRENPDALLLPASAVVAGRVWCVRDGRLAAQPVELGAHGDQRVEIVQGVGAADSVVAEPPDWARAGRRVRAQLVPFTTGASK